MVHHSLAPFPVLPIPALYLSLIVLAPVTPISAAFKLIMKNARHVPTWGPASSSAWMFFPVSALLAPFLPLGLHSNFPFQWSLSVHSTISAPHSHISNALSLLHFSLYLKTIFWCIICLRLYSKWQSKKVSNCYYP